MHPPPPHHSPVLSQTSLNVFLRVHQTRYDYRTVFARCLCFCWPFCVTAVLRVLNCPLRLPFSLLRSSSVSVMVVPRGPCLSVACTAPSASFLSLLHVVPVYLLLVPPFGLLPLSPSRGPCLSVACTAPSASFLSLLHVVPVYLLLVPPLRPPSSLSFPSSSVSVVVDPRGPCLSDACQGKIQSGSRKFWLFGSQIRLESMKLVHI